MVTITTRIFVNDATQIAKDLEKYAYGYTSKRTVKEPYIHEESVYHSGIIDEDDYDAIDLIDDALNMLYACEGDVAEITLPIQLANFKVKICQIDRNLATED